MEARRKRYSAEGWKYVNADGTVWPKDEWIRYSAKHPCPPTVDKAPAPWEKRPDPQEPRTKIARDFWQGEEGGFLAYIIPMPRKKQEDHAVDETQTHVTDYFSKHKS